MFQALDKPDNQLIVRRIARFIRQSVGDRSVLIGLSGGIDSSLSCALAVRALGPERVNVLIVKNIRYSVEHLKLARQYARSLGIQNIIEINTDAVRQSLLEQISFTESDEVRQSTLDARVTDLIIRTVAQQRGLIYLGTINGTERLTGWYPKGALFGDFCPIGGLLKVQVQSVSRYLGLPDEIVNTVSGDARKICSGCGTLPAFEGITFFDLDRVLYVLEARQQDRPTKGIDAQQIAKIEQRVREVAHKRVVFPPYPMVNAQK